MDYGSGVSIDNNDEVKKKKIGFLDILIIVLFLVIVILIGYKVLWQEKSSKLLELSSKKNYTIINKIDNYGFAKLDYNSTLDIIKKIGFNDIDEKIYSYDNGISEQKAYYATNKYYDDLNYLDILEIVFNKESSEVYQIEASLVYKEKDFSLEEAAGDIISVVSNFENIEINTELIKYTYEDLMSKKENKEKKLISTQYDQNEIANLAYNFKYENNCYIISMIIQTK